MTGADMEKNHLNDYLVFCFSVNILIFTYPVSMIIPAQTDGAHKVSHLQRRL